MKIHIGEANEESCFITSESGADIACLSRFEREKNLPECHYISGDEWQKLINLINAASAMKTALDLVLESMGDEYDVRDAAGQAGANLRVIVEDAIELAEK
jgi:hypothetical protein